VPGEAFAKTEEKIDNSFACGYGTVLFFEDQKVVKGLQEAFPSYQENFPGWSLQTSASSVFANASPGTIFLNASFTMFHNFL